MPILSVTLRACVYVLWKSTTVQWVPNGIVDTRVVWCDWGWV